MVMSFEWFSLLSQLSLSPAEVYLILILNFFSYSLYFS